MSLLFYITCFFFLRIPLIFAQCECGFSVNATDAPQHAFFTDSLVTDFTKGLPRSEWVAQNYSVPHDTESRGPYGKNASVSNVVDTPDGVQLWVRAPEGSSVGMAELVSARYDMHYGSFRARMKLANTNGSCGSFFFYHNDTQEIDMEFLYREYNQADGMVNLVIQSPESQAQGYNARNTPGFDQHPLPFRPDLDWHEYRFDWTPSEVAFYGDNSLLHVMTEAIPNTPGKLMLNHWSNGDPGWSGGPPDVDTAFTVSHLHAYFNSSDSKRRAAYKKRCPKVDQSKICIISDDITKTQAPSTPVGKPSTSLLPPGSESDGDERKPSKLGRDIGIGAAVVVALVILVGIAATKHKWKPILDQRVLPAFCCGRRASTKVSSESFEADKVESGEFEPSLPQVERRGRSRI
ncbi:concanavalin A-like lectin/glucanase [Trichodelitschia bisporula]|uniref:Concanavalin A-like lectin/glucanase n=1 Tax=Trichodelitschia bisporula TaxID=703511 RepID=A0A6G1HS43_9PEZI|nr:concanavalin A-like lectin/glucanase [Trichodelitschia bisporula]